MAQQNNQHSIAKSVLTIQHALLGYDIPLQGQQLSHFPGYLDLPVDRKGLSEAAVAQLKILITNAFIADFLIKRLAQIQIPHFDVSKYNADFFRKPQALNLNINVKAQNSTILLLNKDPATYLGSDLDIPDSHRVAIATAINDLIKDRNEGADKDKQPEFGTQKSAAAIIIKHMKEEEEKAGSSVMLALQQLMKQIQTNDKKDTKFLPWSSVPPETKKTLLGLLEIIWNNRSCRLSFFTPELENFFREWCGRDFVMSLLRLKNGEAKDKNEKAIAMVPSDISHPHYLIGSTDAKTSKEEYLKKTWAQNWNDLGRDKAILLQYLKEQTWDNLTPPEKNTITFIISKHWNALSFSEQAF